MKPTSRPSLRRPTFDEPLRRAVADLARRNAWRLLVLFGSAARGEPAWDLDRALFLYADSSKGGPAQG